MQYLLSYTNKNKKIQATPSYSSSTGRRIFCVWLIQVSVDKLKIDFFVKEVHSPPQKDALGVYNSFHRGYSTESGSFIFWKLNCFLWVTLIAREQDSFYQEKISILSRKAGNSLCAERTERWVKIRLIHVATKSCLHFCIIIQYSIIRIYWYQYILPLQYILTNLFYFLSACCLIFTSVSFPFRDVLFIAHILSSLKISSSELSQKTADI